MIEYRHRLVHRGVPVDLTTTALQRSTKMLAGEITLRPWPPPAQPPQPQVEKTRKTLAEALASCRVLEDSVISFLSRWAEHLGFELKIEGENVALSFTLFPSRIVVPPTVIHRPGGVVSFTVQRRGEVVEIRPRDQRDPSLFTYGVEEARNQNER